MSAMCAGDRWVRVRSKGGPLTGFGGGIKAAEPPWLRRLHNLAAAGRTGEAWRPLLEEEQSQTRII